MKRIFINVTPGFNSELYFKEDEEEDHWKYYEDHSKTIEVIYNDNYQKVLAKVHFRTDPSVSIKTDKH